MKGGENELQEYHDPSPDDLSEMVYGNDGEEAQTTPRAIAEARLHTIMLAHVDVAATKITDIVTGKTPGANPRLVFEASKYILEFEFNPKDATAKATDPMARLMASLTEAESNVEGYQ